MTLQIGQRQIGGKSKPYIIAEMSGNHNQTISRALEIVEAAADAGADAVKLQTYKPETITLDSELPDFRIRDEKSIWNGETLFSLYKKAHTPWEWHAEIFSFAKSKGIECFSSPFDETAVDFLESLEVPAYKIASFENIHIPLIRRVARTGKPVIMSTGMASLAELAEAVDALTQEGSTDLVLLKCTSNYPSVPTDANIRTIPHMRELFNCEAGISDHTSGCGVAVAAVALGASVVEKHLTLDRNDGGVDSTFSMEPDEFKGLVEEVAKAWSSLGEVSYGPTENELRSLKYRRSIYASTNIKRGETLSDTNIKVVRPGLGLKPKYFDFMLGKVAKEDIAKGSPLRLEDII